MSQDGHNHIYLTDEQLSFCEKYPELLSKDTRFAACTIMQDRSLLHPEIRNMAVLAGEGQEHCVVLCRS